MNTRANLIDTIKRCRPIYVPLAYILHWKGALTAKLQQVAAVLVRVVKMADQWDSKLDVDKDSDIATELKIYNVELTNKILDTGSFGSFVEAWWYGGPCVAKQVHSKFFESSHSEGERSILAYNICVHLLH